jgi:DNA-binding NtrC family response regulator
MVLQALASTLRKHFDVIGAANGSAALALLERDGPFPVVISDYRMPGMDGAAFLCRVRERFPAATRILLTGAGAEGEDVTGNAGLVFRLLSKPCPRQTLIRTIEEALEQSRAVAPTGEVA